MATSLSTTVRNSILGTITTAAGSTAYLWVWTGSAPAKSSNAFVTPTGTNLALFALPNPIAPTASVGVLTYSAITSVTGLASGTPGYVRQTAGTAYTLSQAAISGSTVTYTGTGIASGMTGVVNISGFVNAGNNGTFTISSSTTTTIVVTNSSGVNETHAATAVVDVSTNAYAQNSAGVGSGDFSFASTVAAGGTVGITSITLTEGDA
jgi:hypothetical protein